mgnify:CR=1 FL=1
MTARTEGMDVVWVKAGVFVSPGEVMAGLETIHCFSVDLTLSPAVFTGPLRSFTDKLTKETIRLAELDSMPTHPSFLP